MRCAFPPYCTEIETTNDAVRRRTSDAGIYLRDQVSYWLWQYRRTTEPSQAERADLSIRIPMPAGCLQPVPHVGLRRPFRDDQFDKPTGVSK